MTKPEPVGMRQTCYSYSLRELGIALGLAPTPFEWVVVEIDEDTVDVMIRCHEQPRETHP